MTGVSPPVANVSGSGRRMFQKTETGMAGTLGQQRQASIQLRKIRLLDHANQLIQASSPDLSQNFRKGHP